MQLTGRRVDNRVGAVHGRECLRQQAGAGEKRERERELDDQQSTCPESRLVRCGCLPRGDNRRTDAEQERAGDNDCEQVAEDLAMNREVVPVGPIREGQRNDPYVNTCHADNKPQRTGGDR